MKAREEVTVSQLFQVLELTVSDGPKELKIREDKFKALWVCATPDVRRAHNQNGHTVLHTMVIYGFEALIHDVLQEMPELALKHAKDGEYPIDERDRAGKTPLTLARRDNSPDVEVVLIAQGADENLVEF